MAPLGRPPPQPQEEEEEEAEEEEAAEGLLFPRCSTWKSGYHVPRAFRLEYAIFGFLPNLRVAWFDSGCVYMRESWRSPDYFPVFCVKVDLGSCGGFPCVWWLFFFFGL